MDKTPHFVVVELNDGEDAEFVAKEIVNNLAEVKEAYPAFSDGFGNIVQTGESVFGLEP